LVVKSVQWAHWNGDVRLDEAQKLTRHAAPQAAVVIGGDFLIIDASIDVALAKLLA
jgi:hypothetical protein